jgi:putative ABC transport system substrate-binding protein
MRRRDLIVLLGVTSVEWPTVARAQQAMPVIGYLSVGSQESDKLRLSAFRRGLGETGYVEGQNLVIEYRWAEGEYDRLATLADDLTGRQVTVIVSSGAPPAFAAKAATATIPIVFNQGVDPVQSGLVASLNRPAGNVTGVLNLSVELMAKRLDLLRQLQPTTDLVALLINPTNPAAERVIAEAQEGAGALGLQPRVLKASTITEIDAAFESLAALRAGALVVYGDPFFINQKDQIIALAAHHSVPAFYECREFVVGGGLMGYGTNFSDSWRQTGVLSGKILSGAKPAELPIQQAVEIELVINLQTARSLGLTMPPIRLARADEVIE